jgi:hypothetical protein
MIFGMTTKKIAITVPAELLLRAKEKVREQHASSLSAFISVAIKTRLMHDDLDALLTELLLETGGPLTAREVERADQRLGLVSKPKTKRGYKKARAA